MQGNNINTKRIARNTIMLYIRMILIMVVTIYMSRVILQVLGIEDYGTYNVVAGAVAFLGFLNNAMSMATQRFFNVELGKIDSGNLNKVFNMSMNIHVMIGLIVIILAETVGLWLINDKLNIPTERMFAANCAYQCVIASTFFTIIQVPYNSAIFAYEKMDIFAYLSIFEVFLKLGLTYLLFLIDADKLVIYSVLMLAVQLLIYLLYSYYVSRKLEGCTLHLIWDTLLFKSLVGFLGWNICGQIAQVLTTQGVNIVANVFYGVILNAAIAITNQVNGAITMFVHNFQTSFRPQIMKSYAAGQLSDMTKLVFKASKASFFLLYLISMPILLNISFILDIWLTSVPDYSASFCKLLIWSSYLEAVSLPLVMAILATGRNKYYQIFVSIVISLNIILTWLFLKIGYSPECIYYIKIIVTLAVIVVRMIFAKKQACISYSGYIYQALIPVLKVVILSLPVYVIINPYVEESTFPIRMLTTALFIVFLVSSIYLLGMTCGERLFVLNVIKSKILKR